MISLAIPSTVNGGYELLFRSLFVEGKALAFPCDAAGHVNIDSLSDAARDNYLYARAVVGREYFFPALQSSDRLQ
jgi:hypothetical protein